MHARSRMTDHHAARSMLLSRKCLATTGGTDYVEMEYVIIVIIVRAVTVASSRQRFVVQTVGCA